MADLKAFAEQLVNLTVKEVKRTCPDPRKKNMASNPQLQPLPLLPVPPQAAAAEEKSAFDVVLKNAGGEKLKVVKLVKGTHRPRS